jgi:predicted metal-dependent hydrolase
MAKKLTAYEKHIKSLADHLGVKFHKVTISDLKYRWGSCTPTHTLNFNWRLIKAPRTVIDYVVVHELAHLLEPNHTPRFWNIIETQVPGHLKAKNWLKAHGAVLESDF